MCRCLGADVRWLDGYEVFPSPVAPVPVKGVTATTTIPGDNWKVACVLDSRHSCSSDTFSEGDAVMLNDEGVAHL
jgi:hypothetical protein